MKFRLLLIMALASICLHAALYENGDTVILEDYTVWQMEEGELIKKGTTDFVSRAVQCSASIEEDGGDFFDVRMEGSFGFSGIGKGEEFYWVKEVVIVQQEGAQALLDLSTGKLVEGGFLYSLENRKEVSVVDCDNFLLLDDGSIWEFMDDEKITCVKGDQAVIQGEYQEGLFLKTYRVMEFEGKEIDVELLGWMQEEAKVDFAAEGMASLTTLAQESKSLYGFLTRLDDGRVFLVGNEEPHQMSSGQAVCVGNLGDKFVCFVNQEDRTILNMGLCIGQTEGVITRTVQEVTDEGYIFDDGFFLERTLKLSKDDVQLKEMLENMNGVIQFDFDEPMKLQLEMNIEEVNVKAFFDLREKCLFRVDVVKGEESGSFNFVGSEALLRAMVPEELHVGDTVSGYRFYPIQNEDKEIFCFLTRE